MKKILLLTTEDWPEIKKAVNTANALFDIKIDLKKINLDVSNHYIYENKSSLNWFVYDKTKSIKTEIIYAFGLVNGGMDYDCYGLIVDKDKANEDISLYGQHSVYSEKSIIEVYAYSGSKNKRKMWGYDFTTYNLVHEIIHFLDRLRGIDGDVFHDYLDKNDTIEPYIRDLNNMLGLMPIVNRKAQLLIKYAKIIGLNLRITSGFRSSQEQKELYEQGRSNPGNIVTNAKPGYSFHNYGVAFDIVDRKKGYNLSDTEWKVLGILGKFLKLEWGGDWQKYQDKPHFQFTAGYSIDEFRLGKIDLSRFS